MKYFCRSLFVGVGLLAVSAWTHGSVEEIKADWRAPEEMRRIRVGSSSASTVVDPASGNYIPAKAHDGSRQTKWVATESPARESPQWIELKLSHEQRISVVAVFGERIGNDGVLDAEIQIKAMTDTSWQTVAAISNATSAAWLATFSEINAFSVRLLVTRSSGPSPHTDVYEVEVYGPRLGAAEQQKESKAQLTKTGVEMPEISNAVSSGNDAAWFGSLRQMADSLAARFKRANGRFLQWKDLSATEQQILADEIDLVSSEVQQAQIKTATLRDSFKSRIAALQAAHALFKTVGDTTDERRKDHRIQLFNRQVLLEFDETANSWDAFWNGAGKAAIFNAVFDLEVDGKHLKSEPVRGEVTTFKDKSGKGRQLVQRWSGEIQIERNFRVYDAGAVTISGRIKNSGSRAVALGSVYPLIIGAENKGSWLNGDIMHVPAAVFIVGASEWQCTPGRVAAWSGNDQQTYSSSQVLNLTDSQTRNGFTVAFLSAFEARPNLNAQFGAGQGGLSFVAQQNFLNRRLDPGEMLDLDTLYLCADDDAYVGLEKYAQTAAHFAQAPVRKGATALWCSWYGHRMAIDENLVLANAAVAAKYFKPLGFEIMQLDHGWQMGDVTGDWIPDPKSFPHGFKWLSKELQSRYGLKLGVWIAPTDVAETSDTFRQHPGWMLKDGNGKPQVNWKWYWKPNPNCYELDVSNPDAARWMENVFARLSADGVSYYKIDFIASSGGEHFVQQDPKVTRGWSVLRKAMESVRRGAGTNAWIRYCQPPPLLSAGLADGAYGGDDTLDAGLNGDIHVLRSNARSLAASYWINDRLYHREVCDMSVRMQADIEEVRMRLAMMTLANCSISFSDELQYLPLSRLRMMQTCLPPGNPPMKPLDLFDRAIPSIWQVHCQNNFGEWDVVGLFNFENTVETRTVDFARLNWPADTDMAAFEFWEQRFGVYRTNLTVTLAPQTSRIFALRPLSKHPQVVGTDLHLLQGHHELKRTVWDEANQRLSGECERAPGIEGRLFVHVPANFTPHFEFPLNEKSARLTHIAGNIWAFEISFQNARENWSIPFDRK